MIARERTTYPYKVSVQPQNAKEFNAQSSGHRSSQPYPLTLKLADQFGIDF